jgi:hypothetical protein
MTAHITSIADAQAAAAAKRKPAAALMAAQEKMRGLTLTDPLEKQLIAHTFELLRMRDTRAAIAAMCELKEDVRTHMLTVIHDSHFSPGKTAASSPELVPRRSLIYDFVHNVRVPGEDFLLHIEDFSGKVAGSMQDHSMVRATKLVLWAAATGRRSMMESFLLNMSFRYKAHLDLFLFEHGLMLWDPLKNRASRVQEFEANPCKNN